MSSKKCTEPVKAVALGLAREVDLPLAMQSGQFLPAAAFTV
jgi:hypothetical protein